MYKVTKLLLMGLLMILLVQVTSAQDLNETYTSRGGVIVQHPAGWEIDDDGLAVSVLSPDDTMSIAVAVADGIGDFFGIATSGNAEALLDALIALLETSGEEFAIQQRSTVRLANGDASLLRLAAPNGSDLLVVALLLADETPLIGLAAVFEGELTNTQRDLAFAIIGSTAYDPSLAVADEFDFDEEEFGFDFGDEGAAFIPDDAVMIADLEPGTLRFSSGAVLSYPEGWNIYNDESQPYITDTASLIYGESIFSYKALLVITVQDSGSFAMDDYASFLMPMMFGLYSRAEREFDAETDLRTITLADGREVLTFARLDDDENQFLGTIFLVPIDAQYYASFILTILTPDGEEREGFLADIEAMAVSAEMTLREGAIQFEGRQLDIVEADCFSTDAYNISEGQPYAIYDCPAGCVEGGPVWGSDIYTNDSAVCVAAVHAGVISSEVGGLVLLTWQPGEENYASTTRNGVTSIDYGAWGGSFSVAPAPTGDE